MENTCLAYNLTMLLVALVSICVLGFESAIKVIGYTLQMLTRFSMKKSLKVPKQVIRSRNSKDRQHHGQKKKKTNNDLQSITQKTKDRGTRTALKNRVNSGAPEKWACPPPQVALIVSLLLHTQ